MHACVYTRVYWYMICICIGTYIYIYISQQADIHWHGCHLHTEHEISEQLLVGARQVSADQQGRVTDRHVIKGRVRFLGCTIDHKNKGTERELKRIDIPHCFQTFALLHAMHGLG